jgi:hypothetical protein
MGYTAGTASGLKHMGMSKKILSEKMALVVKGIPGDVIRLRLRIVESLRDEALRIKEMKSSEMKARYDKKVKMREFKVGDEVLLFDSSLLKQWSRKLDERWLGPYEVVWKGTMGAFSIKKECGKEKIVSGDQLKHYHRRM